MKKLFGGTSLVLILIVLTAPFWLITCTKVEQGYRGAKIDLYADDKGSITEKGRGMHWYNPIGVDFIELPVFTQRYAYVRNPNEESAKDQSFDAVSSDNLTFGVGVAIHYGVNPINGCAGAIYRKYKTGDFKELALGPVRDVVRGTVKNVFSQYEAEAIYGSERPAVMKQITKQVRQNLEDRVSISENGETAGCFNVDQLNLAELRAPKKLRSAVQKKMQAQQRAQEAKAELRRQRILSRKDSVKAAQDAENNRMIAESVTDELLRYRALKKWDGVMPKTVAGSDGTMSMILGNQ